MLSHPALMVSENNDQKKLWQFHAPFFPSTISNSPQNAYSSESFRETDTHWAYEELSRLPAILKASWSLIK